MSFGALLVALRQRWWVLILAAIAAGMASYVYTKLPWAEPRWRTTVILQATGRLDYGNSLAVKAELRPLAAQIVQLKLMREVSDNLHLDLPPERMLVNTKADPAEDSSELHIDYEDSSPDRARRTALEIARVYTVEHNALQQGLLREERVTLSELDRDTSPVLVWPQTRIIIPGAALLGLVAAIALIAALVYFDDTVTSVQDAETYLRLPVLAVLPRSPRRSWARGAAARPPDPVKVSHSESAVGASSPRTTAPSR